MKYNAKIFSESIEKISKNSRALSVLILITFLIKIALLLTCNITYKASRINGGSDWPSGALYVIHGDTFSYTGAMENYITKGEYFFDHEDRKNVKAGRLPHYSVPYFLFRQIFSPDVSHELLALTQVLVESVAVVVLACLALSLFGNALSAAAVWLLCIFALNWLKTSSSMSTESFACSFSVFSIFYYCKYKDNASYKNLIFCGFFMGVLVALKPVYSLIYLPLILKICVIDFGGNKISQKITLRLKHLIVALLPLVFLLTPWTIRNYALYHKFIPLQIGTSAGYNYSDANFAFRRFVGAWGGDIIEWEPTGAGCYFMPTKNIKCNMKAVPERALANGYDRSDVENVRSMFIELNKKYDRVLDEEVTKKFDFLTSKYIQDKPLDYYIISPIRLFVRFFLHSGSWYLPVNSAEISGKIFQLSFKLIQSAIYWLSVTIGFLGLIIFSVKKRDFFILFMPLWIAIFFPFVFRIVEWRHLRAIEPILYLGVAYVVSLISSLSGRDDCWKAGGRTD
jgi:hypothetical protein